MITFSVNIFSLFMYLIFDTETTGLPSDFTKSISDFDNWGKARCVQLAWQLHNEDGSLIDSSNDIIKPNGFEIPLDSIAIHGVSNNLANQNGISIEDALSKFQIALSKTTFLIGHNVQFDINVIGSEYLRILDAQNYPLESPLLKFKTIDTMITSTNYCKLGKEGIVQDISSNGKFKDLYKFKITLSNGDVGILYKKSESIPNFKIHQEVIYNINNKGTIKIRKGFKPPKLEELYGKLFSDDYLVINAHNGAADVNATARCFFELLRKGVISHLNCELKPIQIDNFLKVNKNLMMMTAHKIIRYPKVIIGK